MLSIGNQRARTHTKVLSVVIAILGITAILAVCSSSEEASKSRAVIELEKRGFDDIVIEKEGPVASSYYGTVGQCRFRLEWKEDQGWSTTDKSSRGEHADVTVSEPTAAKIRATEGLEYCSQLPNVTDEASPQGTSDSTNESSAPTP